MRVVLSRKGFDSKYGGYPSLILPDGRLISLPIPNGEDSIRYSELKLDDRQTYYDLMKELGMEGFDPKSTCHLDPDIYETVINRHKNWKPLFGQIGPSQRHLKHQNISVGDLFLFFGWFRRTTYENGKLIFGPNGPNLHVIFGYMQIGKIITTYSLHDWDKWMRYHPHVKLKRRKMNKTNSIYVAKDRLSFNKNLPGASPLRFNEKLVLTKKGYSRSKWNLNPRIFKNLKISYHPNPWRKGFFQSAHRGQEFVIEENTEVNSWVRNIIEDCGFFYH